MEFLTQIFDTIYENFFDPRKRVFVGYLFSAIVIAFLWLCFVKKKTLKECFYNIFDKKIDNRNFRRKIINLDILDKLEEKQEGVAHKPANYYQFNEEKYENHIKKGFFKFEF